VTWTPFGTYLFIWIPDNYFSQQRQHFFKFLFVFSPVTAGSNQRLGAVAF
jgi:hypothetical protein